jgi:hypothetical protein
MWHNWSSRFQDAQTGRGVPLRYVEGLNDARTLLAGCFSILLRRFLRFVEHKVHHDNHGAPEHDLLMPEENFPVVKEDGAEQERTADEGVTQGRVFDDRIRPHRDSTEINQEGNEVDLESPADREKDVQEADENESGADDHPGDTQIVVAPGVVISLGARWLSWWFWRHGQLVPRRS